MVVLVCVLRRGCGKQRFPELSRLSKVGQGGRGTEELIFVRAAQPYIVSIPNRPCARRNPSACKRTSLTISLARIPRILPLFLIILFLITICKPIITFTLKYNRREALQDTNMQNITECKHPNLPDRGTPKALIPHRTMQAHPIPTYLS